MINYIPPGLILIIAGFLVLIVPKQLFKPFAIDKWFAILRLEYRFDSEFNESTKFTLGSMLFSSKIRKLSSEIYEQTINKFNDK